MYLLIIYVTVGGYYGQEEGSVAIIARKNFTLFEEVKHFCEQDSQSKIAFAGGIDGYGYNTIMDMYHLKDGEKVNKEDSEISGIDSWDALEKQACDGGSFSLKWNLQVFFLEIIRVHIYVL